MAKYAQVIAPAQGSKKPLFTERINVVNLENTHEMGGGIGNGL